MDMKDYLALSGTDSQESNWLDFADVLIPTGEMIIADPTLFPDGLVVYVPPGRYHIQVAILTESGHQVVSRLRAFSCDEFVVGTSVGEVSVDFARLGIGDNSQISAVTQAITPEMAEPIWQSLETNALFGHVPWSTDPEVKMPFVIPGDGDGRYTVIELLNGRNRVGVQIEFLQQSE